MMEYHGGMLHYGFTVSRDDGFWILERYDEGDYETLFRRPKHNQSIEEQPMQLQPPRD